MLPIGSMRRSILSILVVCASIIVLPTASRAEPSQFKRALLKESATVRESIKRYDPEHAKSLDVFAALVKNPRKFNPRAYLIGHDDYEKARAGLLELRTQIESPAQELKGMAGWNPFKQHAMKVEYRRLREEVAASILKLDAMYRSHPALGSYMFEYTWAMENTPNKGAPFEIRQQEAMAFAKHQFSLHLLGDNPIR